MPKKAIIVGASSGIGAELSQQLSGLGYEVGLVARRTQLLEDIQKKLTNKSFIKTIDVFLIDDAVRKLRELINQMQQVDLIIINSGIWIANPDLKLESEIATINVNVCGFTAMVNVAVNYFISFGKGHIVGISSIAGLRGSGRSPAYNASKAFVSNYMAGLRQKLSKTKISVTDIRPGLIDTPMVKGRTNNFWLQPVEKAVSQMIDAIENKKKVVYVTKRWQVIALITRLMPEIIYNYIYNGRISRVSKNK
ncbi:MAG: SDR family NAD(P)-dependent oxidoreductase [Candidatus Gygaella obscura]|nr:SDR family NAD(P)-dependent oxidoreductase [Candidatus Gygaella obscura]